MEKVGKEEAKLPEGVKTALGLIEQLSDYAPNVIREALDAYYDKYGFDADNIFDALEQYQSENDGYDDTAAYEYRKEQERCQKQTA